VLLPPEDTLVLLAARKEKHLLRLLLNVVVADRVIELQKGMAAGLIQAVVWDG
jgi:hypothetical protein